MEADPLQPWECRHAPGWRARVRAQERFDTASLLLDSLGVGQLRAYLERFELEQIRRRLAEEARVRAEEVRPIRNHIL